MRRPRVVCPFCRESRRAEWAPDDAVLVVTAHASPRAIEIAGRPCPGTGRRVDPAPARPAARPISAEETARTIEELLTG